MADLNRISIHIQRGCPSVAFIAFIFARLTGTPAHVLHPDLAVLLPTSGSTGSSKLVRISRSALSANAVRAQIAADPMVTTGTTVRQTIRVGGDAAEYAVYVHEGTRPHVIRPRNKQVLAFNGREGRVFAREVHHPGTRARPFLRNALESEAPALGFTVTRA